jgi:hypothetical protein
MQTQWPSTRNITALGFGDGRLLAFNISEWGDVVWILLSTNGLNWSSLSTGIQGGIIRGFASGNGFYVGVGEISEPFGLGDNAAVMTSSNLTNWSSIAFYNTPNTYVFDIAFGNGTFVAVGEALVGSAGGVTIYSTNGLFWTFANSHPVGLTSIAFGKGLFVAVQRDGGITTSPDGVNWSLRPTSSSVLTGVEFGADTFVAVGGTNILESDPLITMSAGFNGQLAIDGRPGRTCRIEYVTQLQLTNVWQLATNLQLITQPTFWIDPDAATQPKRFYRAALVE